LLCALCVGTFVGLSALDAEAGHWFRRRRSQTVATTTVTPVQSNVVVARVRPPDTQVYPMLGTFYPTPYTMVRGNRAAGGGYAPLDEYGANTLSIYGPLSDYRAIAAPVATYTRGYDGTVRPQIGTSFSYPNAPRVGPVIYPTRANVYPGFRYSPSPPWWDSSSNWIDQH
jgi:hypothetical protein